MKLSLVSLFTATATALASLEAPEANTAKLEGPKKAGVAAVEPALQAMNSSTYPRPTSDVYLVKRKGAGGLPLSLPCRFQLGRMQAGSAELYIGLRR